MKHDASLGLITVLDESTMQDWGWRLPFLIAGPLGMIGMYLRSRMEDTPVFREFEDDTRWWLITAWRP